MRRTKISLRMDEVLLRLVDEYAAMIGSNRSEIIRQFCRAGSQNRANMKLQVEFMDEQNDRWLKINRIKLIGEHKNLVLERDGYRCRKCNGSDGISVYHIDKDPLNKNPMYQITLCQRCKEWAEKYSPKRRVLEDFVEWFCLL